MSVPDLINVHSEAPVIFTMCQNTHRQTMHILTLKANNVISSLEKTILSTKQKKGQEHTEQFEPLTLCAFRNQTEVNKLRRISLNKYNMKYQSGNRNTVGSHFGLFYLGLIQTFS